MDLWLVRHGESEGNVDGSGSDSPLTAVGRQQALAAGRILAARRFDGVFSSPLKRAFETATLAMGTAKLIVQEPRISEFMSGPEARYIDAAALDPDALMALLTERRQQPTESGRAFMARVRQWVAELPVNGRVIAFTHYVVVREIIGVLLGTDRCPDDIPLGAVFRLRMQGETAELSQL